MQFVQHVAYMTSQCKLIIIQNILLQTAGNFAVVYINFQVT